MNEVEEKRVTIDENNRFIGALKEEGEGIPAEAVRANVRQANADELGRICQEHGVQLPRAGLDKWRPTVITYGEIRGVPVAVRCVATDGMLGLFIPATDVGHNLGKWFLGHVEWFEWAEGVISTIWIYSTRLKRKVRITIEKDKGCPATLFSAAVSGATGIKENVQKVMTERQRKLAML